ncbi:hypothetical protein ACWOFR_08180 [Carnobacterium gallinarum]|uniref:hypothetical protein n=1 Tax=Carnobacterium gallinarum TaxID=2749 RepID=UPI000557A513|nr:hypothetical protein [Carnobacterium gallinarum]
MTECIVSLSNGETLVLKLSEEELFEKISNGEGYLSSRLIRFYNNQDDVIYINPIQIVKISLNSKNDKQVFKIDNRYQ